MHINHQRDDGYHELQTLFQFLDHGDTIECQVNNSGNINLTTPIDGVDNNDNLIVKAAALLKHHTQCKLGANLGVQKLLPMGGGLGGGSSNAATVLLALNALWKINLPNDELAALGLTLGADVPIFVRGYAAFAEGVGEKLHPASPEEYYYLVTKPPCSISTAEVFTSKDLPRNTPKLTLKELNVEHCHNDCETMVIKHYPEVANLIAWLVEYAPSRMTGTGACVFSRFSNKNEALRIQKLLPSNIESFIAKGLNLSPVLKEVSKLN